MFEPLKNFRGFLEIACRIFLTGGDDKSMIRNVMKVRTN